MAQVTPPPINVPNAKVSNMVAAVIRRFGMDPETTPAQAQQRVEEYLGDISRRALRAIYRDHMEQEAIESADTDIDAS